ncbi:SUKH-3 domain-containing protein [Nocardia sp. IBHARD005]|uniref:SUKH-3 domain-containing protein n=1 Tax=Nocardia sp. IBHARD005 TaxID=3457765 RepID=UPI0040585FF7
MFGISTSHFFALERLRNFAELSENLGEQVFPVGYEQPEHSILLVDGRGRFFRYHHTGAYYFGKDQLESLDNYRRCISPTDAEDLFA